MIKQETKVTARGALNIGGVNGTNEFDDCASGVQIAGDYELHTTQNNFTNCGFGILAQSVFAFPIEISQNNFTNCGDALTVADLKSNPYCQVIANNFIGGFDNDGTPQNENAITVLQASTNNILITISDNVIDDYIGGIWAVGLVGIHGSKPYINRNHIHYNFDENYIGNNTYRGITVENCTYTQVAQNTLQWLTAPINPKAYSNQLYGMVAQDLQNSEVYDNTFDHLGTGLYAYNNCGGTLLSCNSIVNTYPGIFMDNITIPTQGINNCACLENTWTGDYASATMQYRIQGNANYNIKWYYHNGIDPYSFSTNPAPYFPSQVVFPQIATCTLPVPICGYPDIVEDPALRLSFIHSIVADTTVYNTSEDKYSSQLYALKTMKQDSNMITDVASEQFVQQRENENMGLIDAVEDSISNDNTAVAASINSTVVDTNLFETNAIAVNEIAIMQASDSTYILPVTDSVILENIAYQNPANGGSAVYRARAILHLRIVDIGNSNQLRFENTTKNKDTSIDVFPTPTNDKVNIKSTSLSFHTLVLFDATGRTIYAYNFKNPRFNYTIDCSLFNPGFYTLKISTNDGAINSKQIIIIK